MQGPRIIILKSSFFLLVRNWAHSCVCLHVEDHYNTTAWCKPIVNSDNQNGEFLEIVCSK